jgi:hypothetical protein
MRGDFAIYGCSAFDIDANNNSYIGVILQYPVLEVAVSVVPK